MLLRSRPHDIETSRMRHSPQFTEALSHGAPGLSNLRCANRGYRQGGDDKAEA